MKNPKLQKALFLALCAAPQLASSQNYENQRPVSSDSKDIDSFREITRSEAPSPQDAPLLIEDVDVEFDHASDIEFLTLAQNSEDKKTENERFEETEVQMIVNQNGTTKSFKWKTDDAKGDKVLGYFFDAPAELDLISIHSDAIQEHVVKLELDQSSYPSLEGGAWFGVVAAEISPDVANQLPIRNGAGLIVRNLVSDTPAAGSGLQQSDVMYTIDDQFLFTVTQLVKLIQSYEPGDTVHVVAYRKGKQHSFDVELGKRPAQPFEFKVRNPNVNPSTVVDQTERQDVDSLVFRNSRNGPVTIVESNGKVKVLKPSDDQFEKDIEQSIKKALEAIDVDVKTRGKILEALDSELKFD